MPIPLSISIKTPAGTTGGIGLYTGDAKEGEHVCCNSATPPPPPAPGPGFPGPFVNPDYRPKQKPAQRNSKPARKSEEKTDDGSTTFTDSNEALLKNRLNDPHFIDGTDP